MSITFRNLNILPLFLFLCAASVSAQNANTVEKDSTLFPLSFKSPRADGMGSFHAALADDFSTIFVNPAGIANVEETSFFALNLTINDVDAMFNILRTDDIDEATLAGLIKNKFEAGLFLGGPISLGFIRENFGFGFMNQQYFKIWWDRNELLKIKGNVVEEIAFFIDKAYPIANFEKSLTVTPAFSLKPMARAVFPIRKLMLDEFRYVFQNLKQEAFELQFGLGVDVAIQFNFNSVFYTAFVAHDIFTPLYVMHYTNLPDFTNGNDPQTQGFETIKPTYDMSLCFRTRDTFINEYVSDLVFSIDYSGLHNILNGTKRDIWLDIGVGLEMKLITPLWLRLGFHHMLPGGGLGIDLDWAILDLAFFGEVFGNEFGEHKSYSLSIGLSIRHFFE